MTILFNATRFAAIVLVGASFGLFYSTLANAFDKAPKAQMQKQGVKSAKAQAPSTRRTGKKYSKARRGTRKPGNTSSNLGNPSGKKESANGRSLLGELVINNKARNANVLDISNGLEVIAPQSRHRVVVQNGRFFLEPGSTTLED